VLCQGVFIVGVTCKEMLILEMSTRAHGTRFKDIMMLASSPQLLPGTSLHLMVMERSFPPLTGKMRMA